MHVRSRVESNHEERQYRKNLFMTFYVDCFLNADL